MSAHASPPAPAYTPTSLSLLRPADVAVAARQLAGAVTVLPRLRALLEAEQTSISDVVDLVLIDPGLTVRLTQAAGGFGGEAGPARGLGEALLRLGADEVYRVTATFELSRLLNHSLRTYGFGPTVFWRRSLAAALVLTELGEPHGLDRRRTHTLGLLHAVGMLFIHRHLEKLGARDLRLGDGPPERLPATEVRLVGMNHAEVAACALRAWGFAEDIVEPIEYQFRPDEAPRHREAARLLAQARGLAAEVVAAVPAATGDQTAAGWPATLAARVLHVEATQC